MNVSVGSGWTITHLTDRVVVLEKDDPVYRRFTGAGGRVKTQAAPGMDRQALIAEATRVAQENDAQIALRVAKQLMPTGRALEDYRREQARLAPIFAVPKEEPTYRVYRP